MLRSAPIREVAPAHADTVRRSPLLTYHELASAPSPDLYRVEASRFAQQLEILGKLYASGALHSNDWSLSFDDGHRSNAELALPLLQTYQRKAIFFITAGWTGVRSNAMTWNQLAELIRAGHSVQSHGWSHEFLTACTPRQLEYELRQSKTTLEEQLGISVNSISMPGGRYNATVLSACAAAGYQHVYTSDPIFEPKLEHGVWRHGRIMVRRNTPIEELQRFLTGDRAYWNKVRTRHRLKETFRAVLGDSLYHSLWRKLASRDPSEEMDTANGKSDTSASGKHAHTATD